MKIFTCFIMFFILTDVMSASVVGTPPNLSGNTDITNTAVWTDEDFIITGDITIRNGGSLLLNNTKIRFNCSTDTEFGLVAEKGGKLEVLNNSLITAFNVTISSYIPPGLGGHGRHEYSGYVYCEKDSFFIAKNSTFSYLGSNQASRYDQYRGVSLRCDNAFIDNCVFTYNYCGLLINGPGEVPGANNVEISSCTAFANEYNGINIQEGAYYTKVYQNTVYSNGCFGIFEDDNYYTEIYDNRLWNNRFAEIKTHISSYGTKIYNNTIYSGSSDGIGIEGGSNHEIYNNDIADVGGSGIDFWGAYGDIPKNMVVRNNLIHDNATFGIRLYYCNAVDSNNLIKDNTIYGSMWAGINIDYSQNTTIQNNTIHDTGSGNRGIILYHSAVKNIFQHNNVYKNRYGCLIGINSSNNIFLNEQYLNNTADIYFGSEVLNDNKFINVNYVSTALQNSRFNYYLYLDVQVVDKDNVPIVGAVVNITNEVDKNYPSIDINGGDKTSFVTGADGHTALPLDPANSLALLDFWETSLSRQEFTYHLTVTYKGITATLTGLNPDKTWYRDAADVYPDQKAGSLLITLPVAKDSRKILIYPNPYIKDKSAGTNINFANLPSEAALKIFTIAGELVKIIEQKDIVDGDRVEWDVSEASGGIYLYVITSVEGVEKGKISIIK